MRTPARRARLAPRFLSLMVVSLVLSSCGTSATDIANDLFMRYRANGSLIEYSLPAGLLTAVTNTTGQSNAAITGNDGGATYIAMTVWDVVPITTGTYAGFTGTTGAVGAIIGYQDAAGINFASGVTAPEATIVITEFSATHVAGTFFGVLQESGEPDVVITEGSFRTARIN
ncbi:MAG: hypothetical protein OEO79_10505 [Gemmatimonadota bacterium]|nr:hypothetical protein [Gemmatimonadota bacterium]MDH3422443.1 hypothetical protein [Gemmatimonadota bacterium]